MITRMSVTAGTSDTPVQQPNPNDETTPLLPRHGLTETTTVTKAIHHQDHSDDEKHEGIDSKKATNGDAFEHHQQQQQHQQLSYSEDRIHELRGYRWFWSRLTFGWVTALLRHGHKQGFLDPHDKTLVPLPTDCSTTYIHTAFDTAWEKQLLQHSKPSLMNTLLAAFGQDFIWRAGSLKLIHDCALFVGPAVLHQMVLFLRSPDSTVQWGLTLVAAVTASQLLCSLCLRHYFFKCYIAGLRLRTAVVFAVYRKALRLSPAERAQRRMGEMTNLVSIDAQRLQDLTTYLHSLWSSPLQISLALLFLWQQLGAASLGGVAVIIVMIPATRVVAAWMGRMQKALMRRRDARVELCNEVLSAPKVLKLAAWEESFLQRILDLRQAELTQLFRYVVGNSASRMLWSTTPLLVALATFAAYVTLAGHVLNVAEALTALALFDVLRFPLFMLPTVINNCVEASIAFSRIRSFLLCDEHEAVGSGLLHDNGSAYMINVSATYDASRPKQNDLTPIMKELANKNWEIALIQAQLDEAERLLRELTIGASQARETNSAVLVEDEDDVMIKQHHSSALLCLKRISFDCAPGQLVAVVGGVGCGKSSLLNALLGELRLLSGTTAIKGSVAYFSQTPFILNATVRDNILFGHMGRENIADEIRYQRALECCALRHDLDMFPEGDTTELGEKGITLSGGQKARVALARAVYHAADITLIDDALAAVDAHVAQHLFEEAITSELLQPRHDNDNTTKRSVILVTNAIQYLSHPRVDKIVVLKDGRVVEEGTYAVLKGRSGSVFSGFVAALAESGNLVAETEMKNEDEKSSAPSRTNGANGHDDTIVPTNVISNENSVIKPLSRIAPESRHTGHVDIRMYRKWAMAAGGFIAAISILLIFALSEIVSVSSNWWLTYWSAHGTAENQLGYLGVYALINLLSSLLGFVRILLFGIFGISAARKLFRNLLGAVLFAPMSFFDTTPIGRIVNRFSKDMYIIDETLTTTFRTYLQTLFGVFSTLVVIFAISPVFVAVLAPLVLFYVMQQRFFTLTYRELKRLDSVSRSPIYGLLGESVDGVAVIRAFSAQETLLRHLTSLLDTQQHAYFLTVSAQSWLAVRLELIGTLIISFATLSAVLERSFLGASEELAGLAGLSISYALSTTQSLNWSVRMASDLEANMVAVERVDEYSQIKSEGDRETIADKMLPESWPTQGEVVLRDAQLRYRPGLPLVLKGVNLRIPPRSKVGVVGRTGAGKSSLMVALMRIVELDGGFIYIDGHNSRELGLAKLRRNIAVIPQDPILFAGTVRSNLDPFGHYQDRMLYDVIENVGLYKKSGIASSMHSLSSSPGLMRVESLDDDVSEGGLNFSVGQRQLMVIAKALLRGSRIVIVDEATAAVDAETDAAIQKVMRSHFVDATCITIAHRVNTIMDSDFILVMDDGRVAEFDKPQALLQKSGMFKALVEAARRES